MKRLSPRRVLLLLLLAVLLAAAAVWLVPRLGTAVVFLRSITPEDILAILPQNQVLAVLLLLGLFLVKSCTVFFPISALHLAAGFLYPVPQAILLNLVGTAGALSLPYWIGRGVGPSLVDRIVRRYPKAQELLSLCKEQDFFYSYLVRVVSCLPMDIMSLLAGAMKIPYHRYLPASLLGMLPITLAITVLGSSITDPTSPAFWISLVGTVVLSVGSVLLYRHLRKKGYFPSHSPS